MARRLFVPVLLLLLLGACNMVVSETPMFADADRAAFSPKEGIWLGDDDDCRLDTRRPVTEWPECALWVVARSSGRELHVFDGKGQSQMATVVIAAGKPAIIQGRWIDDAKGPPTAYYGFYAFEPGGVAPDGTFAAASVWVVECGVQSGSDIRPFAGIGENCRPASKDAVMSAATASRRPDQVKPWRWLRAEGQ